MEENVIPSRETSRPVSRRGLRNVEGSVLNSPSTSENREFSPLPPLRPVTGSIPTFGRIGTATRLASAMSTSNQTGSRIGTAATLGYAGSMMIDRPITQQGLSGLPTTAQRLGTAGGMRLIKDKRYWQAVLQTKINEIQQETAKLNNEKTHMDREQSAKRMYDRKVKESAKELTDLQLKLTDMNIALDSYSSGSSRQALQKETQALRERNESAQNQLEHLFGEKQIADERNKQLEREIEIEKNKISDMILSLPVPDQAHYSELQGLNEKFKKQNFELQAKIEAMNSKKDRLNNIIMASQIRLEAARLHAKFEEYTLKLTALKEEEENKLTPEQEREKLIQDVRANNQALNSISHQMKLVEDQLKEKKELLQLVQQDLEEGNSERHAKYKELKRRDETMSTFLDSFPQSMEEETRCLTLLKNQITYAIEQITLQGINLKSYDLQNSDLLNENNDLTNQNGLLKEYKRLGIQMKQLQVLESRTSAQLQKLIAEEADLMNEIIQYDNVEALRKEGAENMEEFTIRLDELRHKRQVTEQVVAETQRKTKEIKEHLKSNESYKQIAHLEEKLVDLIRENNVLSEVIKQNRNQNDYEQIRDECDALTYRINNVLCALAEKKTGQY